MVALEALFPGLRFKIIQTGGQTDKPMAVIGYRKGSE